MQTFRRFHFIAAAAILLGVAACSLATPIFAGGPAGKADASRPAPDVGRKVYTNDDLGWPSAKPTPTGQAAGEVESQPSLPRFCQGGGNLRATCARQYRT